MNTQIDSTKVSNVSISSQSVGSLPGRVITQNQMPAKKSSVNLYEASSQWRNRPADQRFETLPDLKKAVEGRRSRSRSTVLQLNSLDVVDNNDGSVELVSAKSGSILEPTHWSFGQLCQRIGAPAAYLRNLPSNLVAANLRHSISVADKEDLKFLTVENADQTAGPRDALQAVTSTTYGRIWDADVVAAVERIVERSGGKFFNPKDWSGKASGLYASDHDVFCFMIDGGSIVDGGGERDQLHRGFFVCNSETGAKSFGLKTFLFRYACGNHIVWHAENITELIIRHSQGAPGRFDREAFPKLVEYCNASAKPIEDNVRKAKAYMLPFTDGKKGAEGLLEFGVKHGFTRPEIRGAFALATEEEGQCATLWDLCNGLTAHARGYEFVDSRLDLENRAGKLLSFAA